LPATALRLVATAAALAAARVVTVVATAAAVVVVRVARPATRAVVTATCLVSLEPAVDNLIHDSSHTSRRVR
jgi:hypothetical protein